MFLLFFYKNTVLRKFFSRKKPNMKEDCMKVSRNSRNTQYLYDLWDERYSNRGDNE